MQENFRNSIRRNSKTRCSEHPYECLEYKLMLVMPPLFLIIYSGSGVKCERGYWHTRLNSDESNRLNQVDCLGSIRLGWEYE